MIWGKTQENLYKKQFRNNFVFVKVLSTYALLSLYVQSVLWIRIGFSADPDLGSQTKADPCRTWSRGPNLGRNPDKSLKISISISSNSLNLLQFLEKNLIESQTPFPMVHETIQKPPVWEFSRLCPETSTWLYNVHSWNRLPIRFCRHKKLNFDIKCRKM